MIKLPSGSPLIRAASIKIYMTLINQRTVTKAFFLLITYRFYIIFSNDTISCAVTLAQAQDVAEYHLAHPSYDN